MKFLCLLLTLLVVSCASTDLKAPCPDYGKWCNKKLLIPGRSNEKINYIKRSCMALNACGDKPHSKEYYHDNLDIARKNVSDYMQTVA